MHHTPAARRYLRRFSMVTSIYLALIGANVGISHLLRPGPVILGLMAVATALPVVAMLVVLGMYLREETDEFVRDRIVFSMLVGLGVMLSLSSVLGMLQFENIVGNIPVFLAFPLWCAVWGLVQSWLTWRDRRAAAA